VGGPSRGRRSIERKGGPLTSPIGANARKLEPARATAEPAGSSAARPARHGLNTPGGRGLRLRITRSTACADSRHLRTDEQRRVADVDALGTSSTTPRAHRGRACRVAGSPDATGVQAALAEHPSPPLGRQRPKDQQPRRRPARARAVARRFRAQSVRDPVQGASAVQAPAVAPSPPGGPAHAASRACLPWRMRCAGS
jgi:hypothetical protein